MNNESETIATYKLGGKTYEIDHHGITFPDTQWGLFGVWTGGSEVAEFATGELLDHTELPDTEELIRLAREAVALNEAHDVVES
jgi:hypothetical protein